MKCSFLSFQKDMEMGGECGRFIINASCYEIILFFFAVWEWSIFMFTEKQLVLKVNIQQ